MFGLLKRKNIEAQYGEALFEAALAKAQQHGSTFFADDYPTEDVNLRQQRFETVALFMAVVLWRLKADDAMATTAQYTYDTMFLSFDRSLRESGVGDIGVAHRIKKFAQAFHGRLKTYGDALDAQNNTALLNAVAHNMQLPTAELEAMVNAAYTWARDLQAKPVADLV